MNRGSEHTIDIIPLQRYRRLFDYSSDIILLADQQLREIFRNPAAALLAPPEKNSVLTHIHPDDRRVFSQVVKKARRKPGQAQSLSLRHASGSEGYLHLHAVLTDLSDDPAMAAIMIRFTGIHPESDPAPEQLRHYRELNDYKHALDESAIVAITDQKGIITHVNDYFCKISGYSREELIGMDHRTIYSGSSKEIIRRLWRTVSGGSIWRGELENRAKDGSYYWVDTTIVPFLNEEGDPHHYIAIHSDISARKKAEKEVVLKNTEIADILERITDGFIALDNQFRYTYVNKQIAVMTGHDPSSLIGRNIWEVFPEAVGTATWHAFNEAFEEQRYIRQTDHFAPLNLWHENHIYPSPEGLSVFVRDITRQKQDEQELKAAYQKLSFHLSNTPLAVIEWSSEGQIMQWSAQAEAIFGWKEEDVIGKNFADLGLNYQGSAIQAEKVRHQLATGLIDRAISSTGITTKTGRVIYTEWYSSVLKDEQGRVVSIVSLAQDITSRKTAEDAIVSLNHDLEQKVLARTAQLEDTMKDLESFSYSVSHDLRAPLRTINGYSMMLKDRLGNLAEPDVLRIIDTVISGTQIMGRLIDDLLQFSRMGRKELARIPLNMTLIAEESLAQLLDQQQGKPEVKIGPLQPATGDPVLIKQVWLNLIGNALKYSGHAEQPRIEIGNLPGEPNTYFISDNGVGFDMAFAHKLFGVFQRLHSQAEFEGTGIGLALVKRIIDKHGGRVWAESSPGNGATFFFSLLNETLR